MTENTRNSPLSTRVETDNLSLQEIALGPLANINHSYHVKKLTNNAVVNNKALQYDWDLYQLLNIAASYSRL